MSKRSEHNGSTSERYLSVVEVAERLGTTERFPRRLIEERRIEFKRFGRYIRISEQVLAEYFASFGASLMKEVVHREFRDGGSSVSIPLVRGVRYRVGQARGRNVAVGTSLVSEDTGLLVITSTRTVFIGEKKTLEFRHDRLVGIQQYTDGLRLGVSNRQTTSLFKFNRGDSPTIAAALITRAVSDVSP